MAHLRFGFPRFGAVWRELKSGVGDKQKGPEDSWAATLILVGHLLYGPSTVSPMGGEGEGGENGSREGGREWGRERVVGGGRSGSRAVGRTGVPADPPEI